MVLPEGLHLVSLPAYSPQLQPAERLWPQVNEAVANQAFATIDDLQDRLAERCRLLSADTERIGGLTRYHWWPEEPVASRSA